MAMSEDDVKNLVGLPVAEVERQVTAKGSHLTIVSEDGVSLPILTMYDPNSVSIYIEKGQVIAAVIS